MVGRNPGKTGPIDHFRLAENLEGFLGEAVPRRSGRPERIWEWKVAEETVCGGTAKLEDRGKKA